VQVTITEHSLLVRSTVHVALQLELLFLSIGHWLLYHNIKIIHFQSTTHAALSLLISFIPVCAVCMSISKSIAYTDYWTLVI
jgi:NADH:ubiquinone oxidoreductase subunit 6 (subunit J)